MARTIVPSQSTELMLVKREDLDSDPEPIQAMVPEDGQPKAPPAPRTTLKQWMQVLSAFIVFLNTWGVLLAFGAFQTFYEQELLTEKSSSDIAWIATTCAFILLFSGIVTGPLFDHGYLRSLLVAGSILEVFGIMMLSLSTEYYQVFLSQGICIGIGGGLLYIPSIAAAAASFDASKRARMMGLIVSATGIGGVIYPIMFRQLLSSIGFPWAVRCIGFVVMGTYLLSYVILPWKPAKSPAVRRWIDVSAFKDVPFMMSTLGGFFSGTAYFLPLLYLPLYAETSIASLRHSDLAFYLLAIVNGASVFGRLAAGLLAAKIGPLETLSLALACSSVLLFCWIPVSSTAGIVVWSIVWGFVSSVIVAMPGAVVPILSPSITVIGTRSGMYWTGIALGCLIGGPIGGALAGVSSGSSGPSWWHLQLLDGFFMLLSTICSLYPMVVMRRRRKHSAT